MLLTARSDSGHNRFQDAKSKGCQLLQDVTQTGLNPSQGQCARHFVGQPMASAGPAVKATLKKEKHHSQTGPPATGHTSGRPCLQKLNCTCRHSPGQYASGVRNGARAWRRRLSCSTASIASPACPYTLL